MHDLDPHHSSLGLQHIQDSLQFKQFSDLSIAPMQSPSHEVPADLAEHLQFALKSKQHRWVIVLMTSLALV